MGAIVTAISLPLTSPTRRSLTFLTASRRPSTLIVKLNFPPAAASPRASTLRVSAVSSSMSVEAVEKAYPAAFLPTSSDFNPSHDSNNTKNSVIGRNTSTHKLQRPFDLILFAQTHKIHIFRVRTQWGAHILGVRFISVNFWFIWLLGPVALA
ncbi:hypothetical protein ACFX13_028364 [Malus domestica]